MFYDPTKEHLTRLDGRWCCSYSGGKDSTSLVTWIEYLRRSGWLTVCKPQLVQSDTKVEHLILNGISQDMMALLERHGWECAVVEPKIHEKLYNRILGIGNTPVHPGVRTMRWCTRATKINPMERWRKELSSGLTLTGLRWGESKMRDGKLIKSGCQAGGECGIPEPSNRTYSPIIDWTTCQVVDWLIGMVGSKVRKVMTDVLQITKRLVEVYEVTVGQNNLFSDEAEISAARFGCIGCPAISSEREAPKATIRRNGQGSPLNEIYDVWFEARRRNNRLINSDSIDGRGPIKMAVRKLLFARVMDIQRRAGVVLITPEDEAFIRQCWANKVYPRGWSEADEDVQETLPPLYRGDE